MSIKRPLSAEIEETAPSVVVPDLSHIAEPLRPLAVPVTDLRLDPDNARTHSEQNLNAIRGSLVEYGQRTPLVVNLRTGFVEKGNGTLQAALSLGWTHLAAIFVEDDPGRAAGYALADNRSAELAGWDEMKVEALLKQTDGLVDDPRLQEMLAELGNSIGRIRPGRIDPDEVPLPPDEPITCPGDLWILGNHRLLCGDAGSALELDRLLDGQAVQLVNTDPPFNVGLQSRSNSAIAAGLSSFSGTQHHQALGLARHPGKAKPAGKKLRAKDRPLVNDFVSEQEYDRLLHAWFGNIARVLEPGRAFYAWGGYSNCGNYPPVLRAAGLYFSQAIIWVKEHPVLTRKDFMGNHEWCFYGWREGTAHTFLGPANAVDVWTVKKINPQNMIHLTEKPVELAIRALQYSSRLGENVVDLFGGSGSTLIAAEQTGRRAFLMEIDPLYCDVIVQRWENFTGRKAVRQAAVSS
jgi:DNA modification methylase